MLVPFEALEVHGRRLMTRSCSTAAPISKRKSTCTRPTIYIRNPQPQILALHPQPSILHPQPCIQTLHRTLETLVPFKALDVHGWHHGGGVQSGPSSNPVRALTILHPTPTIIRGPVSSQYHILPGLGWGGGGYPLRRWRCTGGMMSVVFWSTIQGCCKTCFKV